MILRAMTVSIWFWLALAYVLGGHVYCAMLSIAIMGLSAAVWVLEAK